MRGCKPNRPPLSSASYQMHRRNQRRLPLYKRHAANGVQISITSTSMPTFMMETRT
ncbi:uncharacterized protein LACBIDRAFT_308901 [Laccaria bicolor S238N-H82]|uniref:Predicted protein n=1 Tax=Laccaria bicolor (strain S238N-H82 / ATCC MYA-4686) TaxID=486041 RepID=B0CV14_LACBS|nr:uncharacterized protein LACBIDRAFT_308901 [Laccaria bicolor S238N-H82]EDR13249.1 predicted protein [Laccaria bicolor S238N-H82]|eukprot:XP_001875747.1 predicted protein [Laccaria bicolor S238N-H82]